MIVEPEIYMQFDAIVYNRVVSYAKIKFLI